MSAKSALINTLADIKGTGVRSFSPIGPGFSGIEWNKWLNYIPSFQQERMDYLSNKSVTDLTESEIEELYSFSKERKVASISQIYGKVKLNKDDVLQYLDYTTQVILDSLIRKKLTHEEYNLGIEKVHQLVRVLSYDELLDFFKGQRERFNDLSMVDSFILREISKELNIMSLKKTGSALASEIESNNLMRQRSMENASKRYFL